MKLTIRTIIKVINCTEAQAEAIELEMFDLPGFYWGNASYCEMTKAIKSAARSIGVIK